MDRATLTRVLIADDEQLVRRVTREILRTFGHDVVGEAADGEEAVELARTLRPDAIVMDVRMPKLDGIEATRRICAELAVRVVVFSAYPDAALERAAHDAGAAAYLVKGGHIEELIAALAG